MLETYLNPLAVEGVRPIRSWQEWLELWNANPQAEIKMGLLHSGLKLPYESGPISERISFYLSIADSGDEDWKSFNQPGDFGETIQSSFGREYISEIRRMIAKKAYEVVWHEVLHKETPNRSSSAPPEWLERIRHPETFFALLKFFRVNDRGHLVNPSHFTRLPFHMMEKTEEFLFQFSSFAWIDDWKDSDAVKWRRATTQQICEIFKQHRPQLSRILYAIGRIEDVFLEDSVMDSDVKSELTKLVLAQERLFPDSTEERASRNLREAIYQGSKTALIILAQDIRIQEKERLLEIARLAKEENIARQRRQELSR